MPKQSLRERDQSRTLLAGHPPDRPPFEDQTEHAALGNPHTGRRVHRDVRVKEKDKERYMLPHPTHDRLVALGLTGMAKALEEQRDQRNVEGLSFEERLGLLVDREAAERESKRLVTRLKFANLRQNATIEDLNTKAARGLDRALFAKLATGEWIARRQDLLITGKTGLGKSWLACALGHKACRDDRAVLYHRVPRLLEALALARGD